MRLAVLIPVFNAPSPLGESLASLAGDPCPFDIVIVDDGSEPPVALPDVLGTHRVVLIRLPENQGITQALNTGLDYVLSREYEYLARLDAGDVNEPTRLAVQMAHLDRYSDLAMVGAWTRHLDASGRQLFVTRYPQAVAAVRRRLYYRSPFSHPTCMFRTVALRAVGRYDDRLKIAEDYELFWRIADRFPCENIPQVLVTRVEDPDSMTHRWRRNSMRVRLHVQLGRFEWRRFDSWLGIARSLVLFAVPASLATGLKRRLGVVG